MSREQELEDALRAFMRLDWAPDAAPGPSCYLVAPVIDARKAMQTAGKLLDGRSPFPSDIDGSLMVTCYNGEKERRSVWLGGMAYGEEQRALVPEKYLTIFDAVLASSK